MKIHQKCTREFTPKMSTKIHPERGILVDKNVHKNSPKVSTRIHLFCPQKFTFYVYNKFAEFYFFRGSCLPRKENVCTKKMLLQKGFEPILLLHKQLRFACKKSRESLIKRAERPILLVMPHIGKNSTQIHCNPLQGNYRAELLHREILVVIKGNEFTENNFLLFWLHFFPCFNNIEIVALVPVMCTGNCQFILQGFKGCFNTL